MDLIDHLMASEYNDDNPTQTPEEEPELHKEPICEDHASQNALEQVQSPSPSPSPLPASPSPDRSSTRRTFSIPSSSPSPVIQTAPYSESAFSKEELSRFPALGHEPPSTVSDASSEITTSEFLELVFRGFGIGYPSDAKDEMLEIAFKSGAQDTHKCHLCKSWPRVRMLTHCQKVVCGSCRYSESRHDCVCCACMTDKESLKPGVQMYTYVDIGQKEWEKSLIKCGLCGWRKVALGDKHTHIQLQCPNANERTKWYAWCQRLLESRTKTKVDTDLGAVGVLEKHKKNGEGKDASNAAQKIPTISSIRESIKKSMIFINSMKECLRVMNSASGACDVDPGPRMKKAEENTHRRLAASGHNYKDLVASRVMFSNTSRQRVINSINDEYVKVKNFKELKAKVEEETVAMLNAAVNTNKKKRSAGEEIEEDEEKQTPCEEDDEFIDSECEEDGGQYCENSRRSKRHKSSVKQGTSVPQQREQVRKIAPKPAVQETSLQTKPRVSTVNDLNPITQAMLAMGSV